MNNWISVEDKLPDKSCYVLVYMPEESEGYNIMQFYYCGCNEWDNGKWMSSTKDYGITHWQPLPVPPEVK